MESARKTLFARPGLAGDQDRKITQGAKANDAPKNLHHRRAASDHSHLTHRRADLLRFLLLLRFCAQNMRKGILELTIKIRAAAVEQLCCAGEQGQTFALDAPRLGTVAIGDNFNTLALQIAKDAHPRIVRFAADS